MPQPRRMRLHDLRAGASVAICKYNRIDVLGTVMILCSKKARNDATNIIRRMRTRPIPLDESNFKISRILVGYMSIKSNTLDPDDMEAFVTILPHDKSANAVDRDEYLKIIKGFRTGDMSRIYDVGNEHTPDEANSATEPAGESASASGGDAGNAIVGIAEPTYDECDNSFSPMHFTAVATSSMVPYNQPDSVWGSTENLTERAIRGFIYDQAVEARLYMDKGAFDESKERPSAKWLKTFGKFDGAVAIHDNWHTQAEADAHATMEALWACRFPRMLVYDEGSNDSSDGKTPVKKTGMQLLNLNAAVAGGAAVIIQEKFIDANAVIALSCTIKTRENAAEVIAKADFDREKFQWFLLNIRCRILQVKFLTFAHMIELFAKIPIEYRDDTSYPMVRELLTQLNCGDTSMCVGTKARSKIYNAHVSDLLMKLEESIRSSRCEIPAVGFVYATFNPAWPKSLKIGKTYDVSQRVCSLNTACLTDHVAVVVAPSFDHGRDETLAHEHFAAERQVREFFEKTLSQESVTAYFRDVIEKRFNDELMHLQKV
jgi:hypothetical protein